MKVLELSCTIAISLHTLLESDAARAPKEIEFPLTPYKSPTSLRKRACNELELLFLRVHSDFLLVLSILVLKPPETKQNVLSFVGQVLLALLSVGSTITSQRE